jgi:hypothetical protein
VAGDDVLQPRQVLGAPGAGAERQRLGAGRRLERADAPRELDASVPGVEANRQLVVEVLAELLQVAAGLRGPHQCHGGVLGFVHGLCPICWSS